MADNPSIPFGSEEKYPQKTAPYSRDVLDWLKDVYSIIGEKGDKPAHEWSGTSLRFENPNGTWGSLVNLIGTAGADAPKVQAQYSADGTSWHGTYAEATDKYIQFSYDGGVSWSTAKILFKGAKGDQGDPGNDPLIQYSADGTTWSNDPTTPTDYVRFSLDGRDTWRPAIYVKGTDGLNGDNAPNVIIQYSETGSTWHATYNAGVDKFIRFSVNNESTWLVSDRFIGIDGINGLNGDDAYLYIAYADATDGTGFTMTFDSSKDYIAIKATTAPISSPSISDFAGLWKQYVGPAGDNGTNAYCYVAYASDDTGSNFSLTPSATLDYMAVLSTSVYKNPPVQADFNGLWKKIKGEAGSNAYYIELPTATTVHGRVLAGIISQPTGWSIDSGDQLTNPLNGDATDLIVYHNTGKEVIHVEVKSKISDRQIHLMGAAAFSGWEDDDTKDYLRIKDLATEQSIIGIYITFES